MVENVPTLSDPILLFMDSPAFVTILQSVPSWQVVHVRSFAEFSAALPGRKYAMLIGTEKGTGTFIVARYIAGR